MGKISEKARQAVMAFYDVNPFVRHLGMKIMSVEYGEVKMRMYIDPLIQANVYHYAHGGSLMSIADSAMGAACLSANKKVVTLELNINCLKPVLECTEVIAIGRVIHNGSRIVVTECEITDKNGNLYNKARASFFIIKNLAD